MTTTRRQKARLRRDNKRIERELTRLAETDLDQFDYTQINKVDAYLEEVRKVGYEIVARSGSAGYYPVVNRLHKDTLRRRRLLADVAEMLAWDL